MIVMTVRPRPADYAARVRSKLDAAKVRLGLGVAGKALASVGTIALRDKAPKRTGRFASSIHAKVRNTASGVTISWSGSNPPAAFLLDGTRPHEIYAGSYGPAGGGSGARALRFVIDGQAIFRVHVHHPGTKPNPFAKDAYGQIRAEAGAITRAAIKAAMGI